MNTYICPACGVTMTPAVLEHDGRSAAWRARVRLYDLAKPNEPEADSDPDLPADQPGESVFQGLPGVAAYLTACGLAHHGEAYAGLDNEVLRHRLKGLRPTLSRNAGHGVWRVPYTTPGGPWMARVDIQRVTTGE